VEEAALLVAVQRIMAQGVVIVDVLPRVRPSAGPRTGYAQRSRRSPLTDQGPHRMHDKTRIALVAEAGRDPIEQADRPVGEAR
jgi:hypothetical protein